MRKILEEVMAFGRSKYNRTIAESIEPLGGLEQAVINRRNACYRHILKASTNGITKQVLDDESKLSHYKHAMFNLGMIILMLESEESVWTKQ